MRHLVIGGAGFIGSNLAARLSAGGDEVTIVDNFARRGALENVAWLRDSHPVVRVVAADIRSDTDELESLAASTDVVYHLAAQVAVTTSVANPRLDFEVNARGTFNVLEAVRRADSDPIVIYSSTNKVYGALEAVPIVEREARYEYADGRAGIDENVPLDLHSPYGCSKGAGDQYVRDYARIYGLRTVVLRQSCIYGPRQFGIEDQGWLASFCIAAAVGRPIVIYGTGKQVRDLLHVDDLVDLMKVIVERIDVARGEIYNVGGGAANAVSLLEAIGLLEPRLQPRIDRSQKPARPGDQLVYITDIAKVSTSLEWEPKIGVSEGVADLVDWIQASAVNE